MESFSNHFLISMPHMDDPIFTKSLIYMCENNSEGSLGIIINKPDKIIQTTELISRWTNSTDCPRTILTFKSNEIIDVFSCDIKHQTVVNSTGKYYIGNNNYISYNYHINDKIMNSHALEATWEQNEWILIDKKGGENYDQEIRYTKIN